MRTGALPLIGWGLGVAAVGALGALTFGLSTLGTLLFVVAGASAAVTGLWAGWRGRRQARAGEGPRAETLPDLSMPTVAATVGATVAVIGLAGVGETFVWPGLGLLVLALGVLADDLLSARHLAERVERALGPRPELPEGAPPAGEASLGEVLEGEGPR